MNKEMFRIAIVVCSFCFLSLLSIFCVLLVLTSRNTSKLLVDENGRNSRGCVGSECWSETLEDSFSKIGNLVYQKNSSNVDQWALIYEEPGKPALRKFLIFAGNCVSNFGRDGQSCHTADLIEGERTEIIGRLAGDSEVLVSKIIGIPD